MAGSRPRTIAIEGWQFVRVLHWQTRHEDAPYRGSAVSREGSSHVSCCTLLCDRGVNGGDSVPGQETTGTKQRRKVTIRRSLAPKWAAIVATQRDGHTAFINGERHEFAVMFCDGIFDRDPVPRLEFQVGFQEDAFGAQLYDQ